MSGKNASPFGVIEGHLARDQLKNQSAQCVDVHTRVDRLSADLFGRHVLSRPQYLAGGGESRALTFPIHEFRNTKVEELDGVSTLHFAHHDVTCLDVTVKDAHLVRGVHCVEDRVEQADCLIHAVPPLAREPCLYVAPLYVLHSVVEPARKIAKVEDIHDMRMTDLLGGFGYADETCAHVG